MDGAFHFIKTALSTIKEDLPAIILRPYREVNPIRGAALLLDQLVELLLGAISDIQQYPSHPDHVLRAITPDIHCASRQVIASLRATPPE